MSTLDRLVAEKVMGWTFRDRWGVGKVWAKEVGEAVLVRDWSPSTDMNAAMEVVGEVLTSGPIRTLQRGGMTDFNLLWNPYEGRYEATFSWSNNRQVQATHNLNPATAICLAAIAAVGVEYKESDNG